jgi:hypothetical protein
MAGEFYGFALSILSPYPASASGKAQVDLAAVRHYVLTRGSETKIFGPLGLDVSRCGLCLADDCRIQRLLKSPCCTAATGDGTGCAGTCAIKIRHLGDMT